MQSLTKRFLWGSGALLCSSSVLFSTQSALTLSEQAELPELIITANRVPTSLQETGSSITLLEQDFLDQRFLSSLSQTLESIPGVNSLSEGSQRGGIAALRIRGAESDHTLTLIDGVRINDANLTMLNFFGTDSGQGTQRIEVLRGPQSALYGGEAIGGVLSLETGAYQEGQKNSFLLEVGSFGSFRTHLTYQGLLNHKVRWFMSNEYELTENDRSHNDFWRYSNAMRLEGDLSDRSVLGFTLRTGKSSYENPGEGPFSLPARDNLSSLLLSAYLESELNTYWSSKATFGFYQEDFEETGGFSPYNSKGKKLSLDWRNTLTWNSTHQTVWGGILEQTHYDSTALFLKEDAWAGGAYINHLWSPKKGIKLTGGARWEEKEHWDDVLTWRTTASWTLPSQHTRIHGSYGTGYRTPSFFELYGQVPAWFFQGNPDLKPERSKGWDFGVEYSALPHCTLDLTYFENKIHNLIDFSPRNIGKTRSRGIECSLKGDFLDHSWQWQLAYTWMDARDSETGQQLARRPRHTVSAGLHGEITSKLSGGLGVYWLKGIKDQAIIDYSTYQSRFRDIDTDVILRCYANYDLNEQWSVFGRIENALNRDHEVIANYPGRSIGGFLGLKKRW